MSLLHTKTVALAGNPNVGKSTVFNALTGLKQHTGNWAGKTVSSASGSIVYRNTRYKFVDLPGTYSLICNSCEEELARDFLCFGEFDEVIVVCDAGCMERGLNLVLQILEITNRVVVCVNFMDEAVASGIEINLKKLELLLGVPVVSTCANKKKGIFEMLHRLHNTDFSVAQNAFSVQYSKPLESALDVLVGAIESLDPDLPQQLNVRWLALRLLDFNRCFYSSLKRFYDFPFFEQETVRSALLEAYCILIQNGITKEYLQDEIVSSIAQASDSICNMSITKSLPKNPLFARTEKLDAILTSKIFGIPIMILCLLIVFWITISAANYPSLLLSKFFSFLGDKISWLFMFLNVPLWIHDPLVLGVYRVLTWVVAVMLPPMAIFFPLFTLLEDSGYLPRIAFNLDHYFKKAGACGKQALTMCMGFGCNAVGVCGCRIIDSKRERLIAIITNNFVPCNGRFPTLIAIISMFFAGCFLPPFDSFVSAILLCFVIVTGTLLTFAVSRFLSSTLLKGAPSAFTLELPPYRKPQVLRVVCRSFVERTVFVLLRAVCVAAPAGLIIWLMANLHIDGASLLSISSDFLNPLGELLGLDGVILLAFVLSFPANEGVIMGIIEENTIISNT